MIHHFTKFDSRRFSFIRKSWVNYLKKSIRICLSFFLIFESKFSIYQKFTNDKKPSCHWSWMLTQTFWWIISSSSFFESFDWSYKNFIALRWSFWRPEKSNWKMTTTTKFKNVFDFSNLVDPQRMTNRSSVRISTKDNAIILVAKEHIGAKNAKIANTAWRHAKRYEMKKKDIIAWNFIMINLFQIMF